MLLIVCLWPVMLLSLSKACLITYSLSVTFHVTYIACLYIRMYTCSLLCLPIASMPASHAHAVPALSCRCPAMPYFYDCYVYLVFDVTIYIAT